MSTIHDQAMNHVYQQVLQRLLSFFSRAERTALQLLIQRLVVAAGGFERIGEYKVMVAPSGGRESCYTLALMRAAQLSIAGRAPATFQLRVATLRWNGAGGGVSLDNLHRSFGALFLYDDPRVELLMVDHREVLPFNHQVPLSENGVDASRRNMLLMGHRRAWGEPLELWDDICLATAEFYGQVARWSNGVDALVSSEPPRHQKQFMDTLDRALQKAGIGQLPPGATGYDRLFGILDGMGRDFYRGFYTEAERIGWRPDGEFESCRRATFIDIHDMVVGKLEDRWPLLSEFLGFQATEWALHQSDGECADPLVAAHLRGLEIEFLENKAYQTGFSEHVQNHLLALRRADVPEQVCELLIARLGNLLDLDELRQRAATFLQRTFGLSEAQLVCLLFAPFTECGAGLERFLRTCHPGMLVAMPDLHRAMQGLHAPEQVTQWMTDVSGLSVRMIGHLYAMDPVQPRASSISGLAAVLDDTNLDAAAVDRSAEG
jgi:hypothetical protein